MRKAHMDLNSQPRPATGHGMFFAAVLLVLVFPAPESVRAQEIDFSKEVLPVLESKCFKCHGEKKAKSKLRLHTLADVLKGGKNGGAIAPGKSAASLLIKRISLPKDDDDIMPPEGGPLEKSQIEAIRRWIDQGAKWAEGADSGTKAAVKKVKVAELPATVSPPSPRRAEEPCAWPRTPTW